MYAYVCKFWIILDFIKTFLTHTILQYGCCWPTKQVIPILQVRDAAPKDFLSALQHVLSEEGPAEASWRASLKANLASEQKGPFAARDAADMEALTEKFSPKVCIHNFKHKKLVNTSGLLCSDVETLYNKAF